MKYNGETPEEETVYGGLYAPESVLGQVRALHQKWSKKAEKLPAFSGVHKLVQELGQILGES